LSPPREVRSNALVSSSCDTPFEQIAGVNQRNAVVGNAGVVNQADDFLVESAVGVLLTPVLWAVRRDGSLGGFVAERIVELHHGLIFGEINRRVQDKVDTGGESLEVGLDVVALGGDGGVKGKLRLLDGFAAVVASSLPVIAARTSGSRGVQDEVDARGERGDVGLDVVALGGDGGVKGKLRLLDGFAAVVASSLPVIAARTSGSRGVQDEVDARGERGDVGLDVVALGGDGGVKSELHLLDGLAAVVASSLPVIAARTSGSRGVQDEVDTGVERGVVGLDVVALGGNGGVKSELHLLDGLAAVVASSLPVIAARTSGSRGVQDEVDTGVERGVVGLDVVALGGNGGVKSELHLLDGLAAVVASGLPVIAAGTRGSRGVQDEVDTSIEFRIVGVRGTLVGDSGVIGLNNRSVDACTVNV